MKSTGEIYKLARGEAFLRIDDSIAMTLRVVEKSVLYMVALEKGEEGGDTVFVASPCPTSSWGNLFRASFIPLRQSGRLYHLLRKLNRLFIFCRHIEMADSLPLDEFRHVSQSLSWSRSLEPLERTGARVPAALTLVLEVPDEAQVLKRLGERQDSRARKVRALHRKIREMLDWSEAAGMPAPSARAELQAMLGNCIVEWTSVMRTTREISRYWKGSRMAQLRGKLNKQRERTPVAQTALLDTIETMLASTLSERGLDKKRAVVERDTNGLFIRVDEWCSEIWTPNRAFKDSSHMARIRSEDQLVITQADSDEKIIYWSIRSLEDKCIAAFTVTFPAGGMESVWKAWTLDTIRRRRFGGGIILAADNSPRQEPTSDRLQIRGGRWESLRVVVQFNGVWVRQQLRAILACFRELQGKSEVWDQKMRTLIQEHRYIQELLQPTDDESVKSDADAADDVRVGTILSQVRLWHETRLDTLHQIEYWSWANPFTFTSPWDDVALKDAAHELPVNVLDRAERDVLVHQLLKDKRGGLSRSILVHRIEEHLRQGKMRHFAIVGAHRSGKTSILRSVQDKLRPKEGARRVRLPVMLNASVCPPSQLCLMILQGLSQLSADLPVSVTNPQQFKTVPEYGNFVARADAIEKNFRTLEQLLSRLSPGTGDQDRFAGHLGERDALARESRNALCEYVNFLIKAEVAEGVVVLVDEVTMRGRWAEPWAQAFWREIIESEDLKHVSWVISATLPSRESAADTGILNVFYEYNLAPLDEYETDHLISRIYNLTEKLAKQDEDSRAALNAEDDLDDQREADAELAEDGAAAAMMASTAAAQAMAAAEAAETTAAAIPAAASAGAINALAAAIAAAAAATAAAQAAMRAASAAMTAAAAAMQADAAKKPELTDVPKLPDLTIPPAEAEKPSSMDTATEEAEKPSSMDAATEKAEKPSPMDAATEEAIVRPVLTLSARRFLSWVSARMPYFLQVCCYCLFERAKQMRIPLLNSRVAIEVLDREVLPQLTDYLEGEWSRLPEETRQYVLSALMPWSDDPWQMLFEKRHVGVARFTEVPPPVQKALLRSGLIGAQEYGLVAPIVAFWLRRSGRYLGSVTTGEPPRAGEPRARSLANTTTSSWAGESGTLASSMSLP